MPAKHLPTCIKHLSVLIDVSKKKEVEIEARGGINPFLICSVKMMSLTDPTWVSLWSILGMVSRGTVKSTSLQQMKPALLLFTDSLTDQGDGAEGNLLWRCLCRTGFSLLHAWTSKHTQVASSSQGSQWGGDWSSHSWPTNWSSSEGPTKYVNEENKPLLGSLAWYEAHTHQPMCHKKHFIFVLPGSLSFNSSKFFLCHRKYRRTVPRALYTVRKVGFGCLLCLALFSSAVIWLILRFLYCFGLLNPGKKSLCLVSKSLQSEHFSSQAQVCVCIHVCTQKNGVMCLTGNQTWEKEGSSFLYSI